jgi:hypothetical protein
MGARGVWGAGVEVRFLLSGLKRCDDMGYFIHIGTNTYIAMFSLPYLPVGKFGYSAAFGMQRLRVQIAPGRLVRCVYSRYFG